MVNSPTSGVANGSAVGWEERFGEAPGYPSPAPPTLPHPALSRLALVLALVLVVTIGIEVARVVIGSLNETEVASSVDPAVADVTSTVSYEGALLQGTGIVIGSSGVVLTNNHVIAGATTISVRDVGNGRTYDATVVGTDISEDLALLELRGASHLVTARLGDSDKLSVGQVVYAIGNAGGAGGTPAIAKGSITGLDRSITASDEVNGSSEQLTNLIQTDAVLEPGDSGGPLAAGSAQVVGVDTAATPGYEFTSGGGEGFAIPINRALAVARQIEAGRSSASVHVGPTAYLGVVVTQTPFVSGADVAVVVSGSPAEQAGLVAGDEITSLDGQSVTSPGALTALMQAHHPGDIVQLGWTDSLGIQHSASVELGSGPPQ